MELRIDERQHEERIPGTNEERRHQKENDDATERVANEDSNVRPPVDGVAAREGDGDSDERRQTVRRVRLDVTVEVDEVIDGADHRQSHDDDPHGVHHVRLDRSVDEDAVTDEVVVVEVATDDRRTEVDDDASDVHHQDPEDDAAERPVALSILK